VAHAAPIIPRNSTVQKSSNPLGATSSISLMLTLVQCLSRVPGRAIQSQLSRTRKYVAQGTRTPTHVKYSAICRRKRAFKADLASRFDRGSGVQTLAAGVTVAEDQSVPDKYGCDLTDS